MKIVVIQEEIIQTDITPKELTERWKRLEQLPGIDEVVIEVPAHYPNIEQLLISEMRTLYSDCGSVRTI